MKNQKPILLVEDDRVDAMTVTRALKEINVTTALAHVENGEEALAYLNDDTQKNPCILLLDLNMPRMNGIEFLSIMKKDDAIKNIPVIVLTTSKDEGDRLESFNLSIAGYMVKPVDYIQFVEVMKTIQTYWSLSEMPLD